MLGHMLMNWSSLILLQNPRCDVYKKNKNLRARKADPIIVFKTMVVVQVLQHLGWQDLPIVYKRYVFEIVIQHSCKVSETWVSFLSID